MPLSPALRILVPTVLASLVALPDAALACACCPDDGAYGSRSAAPQAFEREEMAKIRFGPTARLQGGNRELSDFGDLTQPSWTYPVSGALAGNAWRLAFQLKGRKGVLELALPARFESFAADIHDGKRFSAGGPLLYKEWRFAGTVKDAGVFKAGAAAPTKYLLVFQGRGGNCDGAEEFTHWHLRLESPKATHAFSGTL